MRILSLLIFCLASIFLNKQTDSPHGSGFKISCKTCHSPQGWQLDKSIYSFNHNTTRLPLVGQHSLITCRQCHPTLKFAEAKTNCNECHNDIHQATVGSDCSRCHKPVSWLVNNINEIHRMSRFPLLGAHRTADCIQCHKSESLIRFDVNGINCIDCHRDKYIAATNPNHVQSEISQDCSLCHPITAFQWTGAGFNHNIFPLTQGHSTVKCSDCHTGGNYTTIPKDCYSCHATDYNNSVNPNHRTLAFSTTCTQCHTVNPGWKPATYSSHDAQFPIYSGRHKGKWTVCTDCHTNPANYTLFNCIICHNTVHRGKGYTNAQCYSCHPKGTSD